MENSELPTGWRLARLSEVCQVIMGTSPPGNSYNRNECGVPLLNGPTEFGAKHPTPVQWTTSPKRLCKPGDILFCVRGSTTGRMNWADQAYCLGRGLAGIRPNPERCLPAFIYHWLGSRVVNVLHDAVPGVFPNFNKPQLESMEIPVPPPAQQQRIVARLEELTQRSEEAGRLHREATEELSRFLLAAIGARFGDNGDYERAELQEFLLGKPRNGWSPPAPSLGYGGIPVLTLSAVTGFQYDGSKVKWTRAETECGFVSRNNGQLTVFSHDGHAIINSAGDRFLSRANHFEGTPIFRTPVASPTAGGGWKGRSGAHCFFSAVASSS